MNNESLENCCIIDAMCGIDTSSPQISRFTDSFNCIKFLLGKNLGEYTIMIITDADGCISVIPTDNEALIKESDENGNTTLTWKIGKDITAESGVVIYQIAAYHLTDGETDSVWYSKEGRLFVSPSIDSTSHSAAVIGASPNLITKIILNISQLSDNLSSKVDKVEGKSLSSHDYTAEEKEKLENIEPQANKNIQADWNDENIESDAYIKNKPDIKSMREILEETLSNLIKHQNNETSDIKHLTDSQLESVNTIDSLSGNINSLAGNVDSLEKNKADKSTVESNSNLIAGQETRLNELAQLLVEIIDGKTKVGEALYSENALLAQNALADTEGNNISTTYVTKDEFRPATVTEVPPTLVPNTAYNFASRSNITLSFPSVANEGDVIYINFISRETTNLVVDTTNTYDFELIPEKNIGYEIYAKCNTMQGVVKWIVKYSEYSGVGE